MKTIDKYKYWILLSNYDLETVKVLIEGERWVYVAYVCQQAIERQLKGMYVYYTNKEAPKTHNASFLFEKIISNEQFVASKNSSFLSRKEECEDFLVDVMFYYMSDYPFSYKNIANRFIDRDTAQELYKKTVETIEWLRGLQPMPETVSISDLI